MNRGAVQFATASTHSVVSGIVSNSPQGVTPVRGHWKTNRLFLGSFLADSKTVPRVIDIQ